MSIDTDPFSDPSGLASMPRCLRGIPLVPLCLGLVLALAPSPSWAAMAPVAPGEEVPEPPSQPQPTPQSHSASVWLKAAGAAESDRRFADAGLDYRYAFDALRLQKRRANEGARIAMFCAEAYRLAFDVDVDIDQLDEAHEVLEGWRELAGPDSKATLAQSVKTMLEQIEDMRAPFEDGRTLLEEAQAARSKEDRTREAELVTQAIEIMKARQRPWSAIALLVARRAGADIAAFDAKRAKAEVDEGELRKLEATKSLLDEWRKQRPEADDSSAGSIIDQRLVEIQARIDENSVEPPPPPKPAPVVEPPPPPLPPPPPPPPRAKAITLLSVGGVATVAGAALLGEGVAFSFVARRRGDAEEAEADGLQQQYGNSYPRDQFDDDLQRFRDEARIRNIGFIAGGAVLLAGGLASGIAGAVLLRKSRPRGSGAREKLVLIPTVSRSQLHLSLTTRF